MIYKVKYMLEIESDTGGTTTSYGETYVKEEDMTLSYQHIYDENVRVQTIQISGCELYYRI